MIYTIVPRFTLQDTRYQNTIIPYMIRLFIAVATRGQEAVSSHRRSGVCEVAKREELLDHEGGLVLDNR